MSNLELLVTGDGSHSLINRELDETYHSRHGAVQESNHVFIRQGFDLLDLPSARILEIGFGAGLNAWLTWQAAASRELVVQYDTLETQPLASGIWKSLNYAAEGRQVDFQRIHEADWGTSVVLDSFFSLHKREVSLLSCVLPESTYHLVYFDAFAPNKQPEMWAQPVLAKIAQAMRPDGVFVTYCAKGQVKRDLRSSGFDVEAVPGPPGKREMIRAIKR